MNGVRPVDRREANLLARPGLGQDAEIYGAHSCDLAKTAQARSVDAHRDNQPVGWSLDTANRDEVIDNKRGLVFNRVRAVRSKLQ